MSVMNMKNKTDKTDKIIYDIVKRGLDIIMSIIMLVFAIPIIGITCIAVVLESKGNPIYKQERLGKDGKEFNIYKIRSMVIDAEKDGAKWAVKNDSRVTKVGKFIRKTRVDELPQLLNLLVGDMSLIGPRPERRVFADEFSKTIPDFGRRLEVKPGLTGLAQVCGGYDLTPAEKLVYDIQYIETRSFLLDVKIFFKTIAVVITGDGAR
ncbi:MAG: sugar transferase [Clostridium sp.]